jgi:hypothetical protein
MGMAVWEHDAISLGMFGRPVQPTLPEHLLGKVLSKV